MILTYVIAYLLSYLLATFHLYIASGVVLMAEAIVLYAHEYRRTGHILNLSGLYSLSLVGGEGISCLKLSYIQTDWEPMTWICFFLAYIGFRAGISTCREGEECRIFKKAGDAVSCVKNFLMRRSFSDKRLLIMNCCLAAASWLAFTAEAVLLGYIPFFVRGVPHAYSEFHISGVHYFTVSAVLCPSFSLIWYMIKKKSAGSSKAPKLYEKAAALAAALSGFVIPVLCVSRFQFVFALMLAVFIWIVIYEHKNRISTKNLIRLGCGCALVLVPAYIVLTIARSHDAEYLKGIFEMKKDYPIVFSHFYIYIANNFDNFDCMVKNLTTHTFGVRQLFPLLALTGLKFVFPQLVTSEYFITKKELGTLTLFYDAYYDFGVAGVLAFTVLLGMAGSFLERSVFRGRDAGALMLYGQFAIYMALAFFTTWFSNPTTWFYIGVTIVVYMLSLKKDAAAGVVGTEKSIDDQ